MSTKCRPFCFELNMFNMVTWRRLSVKMSSYQYKNSHYKDKTVWQQPFLYNENTWKDRLYIEAWPNLLTHWGRVTHICVSKLTIIGSGYGLSPGRRQAIIWTNDGILLIGPLTTNFSDIFIEIHTFSFKKKNKMLLGKWRPFCLGLNVLTDIYPGIHLVPGPFIAALERGTYLTRT